MFSLSSAHTVGISPASLIFNTSSNTRTCQNFYLETIDYSGRLAGSDFWSRSAHSRELSSYTYNSSFFDIDLVYPSPVAVSDLAQFELCMVPHREGNFSGVLVYTGESGIGGVGVWINLLVHNQTRTHFFTPLQNFFDQSGSEDIDYLAVPLLLETTFLECLLCFFLFFTRYRNH